MLNPDYRDMLSALNEVGAEFLLVGAYALAAHGRPRATGDMDIWVRSTRGNADKVMVALARFGASVQDLTSADLATSGTVFQIGVAPRRIDILTSIQAVDFDEAWQHRLQVDIEGLTVPVIGREELLKNKKAVARPQDLADVAWLESSRD